MVQRICDHVHGPTAFRHWTSKGKRPQDYEEELDWETLGQAMKSLPTPRRWFVTKHISGMCGVRKFLVRWKEKNIPDCPCCGAFEDAKHAWICSHPEVRNMWKTELDKLLAWLV